MEEKQNMNEIIGCDLDGVIAVNNLNKADYRPYWLHEYYSKAIPTNYSKMPIDVIITGRRIHYMKVTVEWLVYNGINFKTLVMFPNKVKKSNTTLAQYKAQNINDLGITVYYEDDERIANYLKQACPQTKIFYVTDTVALAEEKLVDEIEI